MSKRILSVLLAALMLISMLSLFSCKKNNQEGANSTEGTTSADELVVDDNVDPTVRFDVPAELDYGGQEFAILTWENTNEFGNDTLPDKTIVNQAVLTRDNFLEQYLGVTLKVIYKDGQWAQSVEFAEHAYKSIFAQNGDYDLICAYSMVPSILTPQSALLDISSGDFGSKGTNYLDFDKRWWPEFMKERLTVNEKTYSMSGDASITLLYNLSVVMMDYAELRANQLDPKTIYNAVDSGDWTLEYWLDLCKDLSRDNGDSVWDQNDYYAITGVGRVPYSSFYFSTGNGLVDNKNGRLVISDDITSERAINVYDMVYTAMHTDHSVRNSDTGEMMLIGNGNAIFEMGTTGTLGSVIETSNRDVGMVPFPKYDKNDSSYITLVQNTHSHFCIPSDAKDPSLSSAVLETLGYSSYDVVSPVVYENVMKLRYSKDPDSSRMFDIIRDGAMTDAGILNYWVFVGNNCPDPLSMFRNLLHDSPSGGDWLSNFENRYKSGMEKTLNDLNVFYLG